MPPEEPFTAPAGLGLGRNGTTTVEDFAAAVRWRSSAPIHTGLSAERLTLRAVDFTGLFAVRAPARLRAGRFVLRGLSLAVTASMPASGRLDAAGARDASAGKSAAAASLVAVIGAAATAVGTWQAAGTGATTTTARFGSIGPPSSTASARLKADQKPVDWDMVNASGNQR